MDSESTSIYSSYVLCDIESNQIYEISMNFD